MRTTPFLFAAIVLAGCSSDGEDASRSDVGEGSLTSDGQRDTTAETCSAEAPCGDGRDCVVFLYGPDESEARCVPSGQAADACAWLDCTEGTCAIDESSPAVAYCAQD